MMKKNHSGGLFDADCSKQIGRYARLIFHQTVLCLLNTDRTIKGSLQTEMVTRGVFFLYIGFFNVFRPTFGSPRVPFKSF